MTTTIFTGLSSTMTSNKQILGRLLRIGVKKAFGPIQGHYTKDETASLLMRKIVDNGGVGRVIINLNRLDNHDPSVLIVILKDKSELSDIERRFRYTVLMRHHLLCITEDEVSELIASTDTSHKIFNIQPRAVDVKVITSENFLHSYSTNLVPHGTRLYRLFKSYCNPEKLALVNLSILVDGYMYGYSSCCIVEQSLRVRPKPVFHIPTIGTGFTPCRECAELSFIRLSIEINKRRVPNLHKFPYTNPTDVVTIKDPSLLTSEVVADITRIVNGIDV